MTPEEALQVFTDRKRAYQIAFGAVAGKTVLDDLVAFCRGKETCVVPGKPDLTNVLEGRREALLRIQDHLELTPEQLVELYTKRLSTGEMTDA